MCLNGIWLIPCAILCTELLHLVTLVLQHHHNCFASPVLYSLLSSTNRSLLLHKINSISGDSAFLAQPLQLGNQETGLFTLPFNLSMAASVLITSQERQFRLSDFWRCSSIQYSASSQFPLQSAVFLLLCQHLNHVSLSHSRLLWTKQQHCFFLAWGKMCWVAKIKEGQRSESVHTVICTCRSVVQNPYMPNWIFLMFHDPCLMHTSNDVSRIWTW